LRGFDESGNIIAGRLWSENLIGDERTCAADHDDLAAQLLLTHFFL
jgi:hypothetical protein